MNQLSVDAGNLVEVHTENAIVLGAKVVVGVARINLRGRNLDRSGLGTRFGLFSSLGGYCRVTGFSS